MGLIVARTGADLMSGDNEQVMSDYDGRVRLAPLVNLIPDPGFFEFDPGDGKNRYWKLRAAKRPTHWLPFARDNKDVKQFARQTTAPLPMSDHAYDIEELFPGASPVDENQAIAIARPDRPRTKVVYMADNVGFPAGWITVAYAWILGDDYQTSWRITSPGPRSEAFEIGQGMGFLVATPAEIPAGAIGVAFYVSAPRQGDDGATAALTAPMYLTNRFRSRGIEQFLRITGPLNMKDKFEGDYNDPHNGSYVGNREQLAPLNVWRGQNPLRLDDPMEVQLSYSVYTDVGMSRSSDATDWKHCNGRQSIAFRPRDFSRGVIGWRPEVRFRVKNRGGNEDDKNKNVEEDGVTDWYAITRERGKESFFGKAEQAHVYSNSPGTWHEDLRFGLESISKSESDGTGLPAPAEPVEVVDVLDLNNSALVAGRHFIKTALCHGEEEGPVSTQFETIDIDHQRPNGTGASEAIRVFRPMWHNRMDNTEAREKDLSDIDIPRGWWIAPKAQWGPDVSVRSPEEGIIKYFDSSGNTTDFNAFRTPIGVLEDGVNRYNLRYRINLDGYSKGRVRVYLEEYGEEALYNDDASPIRTQLVETHGGNHDEYRNIDMIVGDDEPYRPRMIPLTSSTLCVRLLVQGMGSGRAGGRNFDVEFSQFGFFTGHGRPRKQNELDRDIGHDQEKVSEEHPHGGYCVVRVDPQDAPQYRQYAVLDKRGFEATMPNDAILTNTFNHPAEVTRNAAIYGDKGIRIAKNAVTAGVARNTVGFSYAPANMMAAQISMHVRSFSNHNAELWSWRTDQGDLMAMARLQPNGTLDVVYKDGNNIEVVQNVMENVEDGENITLELKINSNAGTLKIRKGRNKHKLSQTITVDNIAWGNREPSLVELGYRGKEANGLQDIYYDELIVTDTGTDNTTPQRGNYIEYYGPHRTPKDDKFGPTGLRVPVRPNQDYNIGANMWYSDAPANTTALRVRAMNKKHEELRVYAPVINLDPSTHEEKEWERYDKSITTPPGTAYLEFFANGLSEGTVRLHGIQLKKGSNTAPFDMTNARNGWFSVFLGTRQEAVGPVGVDPVGELGVLEEIRDVNVIGTEEPQTSYSVEYRSADTFEALEQKAYTNNWSHINHRHAIIEVRVNMATNNEFNSPEIRRIEIDGVRAHSHLCREDGTEYKGATLAKNVSSVHAPPRSENIELASGSIAEGPWGTKRVRRISFDVEVYRKSVVEEITRKKHHTLVTPWATYGVTLEEQITFEPHPQTRKQLSWDDEFFQKETASYSGWITSEIRHDR